jgi:large subunit ribosomal protein L23
MRTPDEIIIKPVISEKSIEQSSANQYTFLVKKDASKKEIAKSIEAKFKVTVLETKVINVRGKRVRFGKSRKEGKRQDQRKAVVVLKPGQKIALFEVENK